MIILNVLTILWIIFIFPLPFWWVVVHYKMLSKLKQYYQFAGVFYLITGLFAYLFYDFLTSPKIFSNSITIVLGIIILIGVIILDFFRRKNFSFKTLIALPELNPKKYKQKLVTTGIFSYIRHPRYLEYMLTSLAFALISGLVIAYVMTFYTIISFYAISIIEETELTKRYGKVYNDYKAKVPSFLPK